MKTCHYCGGNNHDSAKICLICGRDLQSGEQQTPASSMNGHSPAGHSMSAWTSPRPESPLVGLTLIGPALALFLLGLSILLAPSMEYFYDLALPDMYNSGLIGGLWIAGAIGILCFMLVRMRGLSVVRKGYYMLLRDEEWTTDSRPVNLYKRYRKRMSGWYCFLWLIPVALFAFIAVLFYMGSFALYILFIGIRINLPDVQDPVPYIMLAVLGIAFLLVQFFVSLRSTLEFRRYEAALRGEAKTGVFRHHTGLAAAMDARYYPQPEAPAVYLLAIPPVLSLVFFALTVLLAPSTRYFLGMPLPRFAHPGMIALFMLVPAAVLLVFMIRGFFKQRSVNRGYLEALHMDEHTPYSQNLENYAHYQERACSFVRSLLWLLPVALFLLVMQFMYVSSYASYMIILGQYRLNLPDVENPIPYVLLSLLSIVFLAILFFVSASKAREYRLSDIRNKKRIQEENAKAQMQPEAEVTLLAEEDAAEGGIWGDAPVETAAPVSETVEPEIPAFETAETDPVASETADVDSAFSDFSFFLDGDDAYETADSTESVAETAIETEAMPTIAGEGNEFSRLYEIDASEANAPTDNRYAANLHQLCEWFLQFARANGFEPELSSARALLAAMAASRVIFLQTSNDAEAAFAKTLARFFGSNAPVVEVKEDWRSPGSLLFDGCGSSKRASECLCGMYRAAYHKDSFCVLTLTDAEQAEVTDYLTDLFAYAENPKHAYKLPLVDETSASLPNRAVFCPETDKQAAGVYMDMPTNVWCLVVSPESANLRVPETGYMTGAAMSVKLRGKACEPTAEENTFQGLSAATFRRQVRGITERCFLPEEQWKKFDRIENFLHERTGIRFDNRLMRRLEKFSSAFMAVDNDANQILDAMLEAVFLPLITEMDPAKLQSIDGSADICETMALAFGADNIPFCMHALRELGYEA